MEDSDRDQFVQLLTAAQPQLFGYICALLGSVQEAGNVLQETNLVLWKKAADFQPGTSFMAWAREVAYFKALSFVRDRKRSRLVLDQELVERALDVTRHDDGDERRVALRHCLATLEARQRDLLRLRYQQGAAIEAIAREANKSEGAIKMALRRIRLALLECINRKLGTRCDPIP